MKPFQNEADRATAQMPIGFKSYRPDRLPDAARYVNCIIIVNDPKDRDPRPRLAMSNGASWDVLAWQSEVQATPQAADISGLVRQAIAQAMAEMPKPTASTLPATIQPSAEDAADAVAVVARVQLQTHALVEALQIEVDELRERLKFVESRALAKAEIVAG